MSHIVPAAGAPALPTIAFDDWLHVEIRIGTVIEARPFPKARKPALKLVTISVR